MELKKNNLIKFYNKKEREKIHSLQFFDVLIRWPYRKNDISIFPAGAMIYNEQDDDDLEVFYDIIATHKKDYYQIEQDFLRKISDDIDKNSFMGILQAMKHEADVIIHPKMIRDHMEFLMREGLI